MLNDEPGPPESPKTSAGSNFSTQSILPLLLFLVVNRVAGLRWAVVVATAWSVKTIVDRKRRGLPLGRFVPIVTAAVLVRGAIGAITESETLYFGLGIATKYLVAVVSIGSVLVKRPLAGYAAPYIMALPDGLARQPIFATTMSILTVIAGCYYTISATLDIWLFRRSSVEGFVVLRFLANWPLSAVAIAAAAAITHRRLQQIPGAPSLSTLVEQRLGPGSSDTAVPDHPETTPDD